MSRYNIRASTTQWDCRPRWPPNNLRRKCGTRNSIRRKRCKTCGGRRAGAAFALRRGIPVGHFSHQSWVIYWKAEDDEDRRAVAALFSPEGSSAEEEEPKEKDEAGDADREATTEAGGDEKK